MQHAAQQDLDAIVEVVTAEIQILHPLTKQPTGNTITIAGPEHPARRKIAFDRARKMRAQLAKKGRVDIPDPAEAEENETDALVASTLDWNIRLGGVAVPFSPAEALKLYTDPRRAWLRAQVAAALDDRENFIQDCAALSLPTPSISSASTAAAQTVQP